MNQSLKTDSLATPIRGTAAVGRGLPFFFFLQVFQSGGQAFEVLLDIISVRVRHRQNFTEVKVRIRVRFRHI